jgi:hypothetical protein
VFFTVEAEKYFKVQPERLAEVKEADLCNVVIDFIEKKAYFTWVPEEGNKANSPLEEDNFSNVFDLWWELECPVQSIETYNSLGHKKKINID